MMKEVKIIWGIFSALSLVLILCLFFLKSHQILELTPTCISVKKFNQECFMCGMTRAFICCSKLDFTSAYRFNRGSIFLYTFMYLNLISYLKYVYYTLNLKKSTK